MTGYAVFHEGPTRFAGVHKRPEEDRPAALRFGQNICEI